MKDRSVTNEDLNIDAKSGALRINLGTTKASFEFSIIIRTQRSE